MAKKPPPRSDWSTGSRRGGARPPPTDYRARLAPGLVPPTDLAAGRLAQLRANEQIWMRFRQIELEMLNAESLADVVAIPAVRLPQLFPLVHAVSVAWIDPEHEWSRELMRAGGREPADRAFVGLTTRAGDLPPASPYLGPLGMDQVRILFPGVSRPLRSAALIPMRLRDELVGSLNQGSSDAGHFAATAATDLLEHLAAVTALCMDNAANRARLRRDSLTDALTGVANRRFFERRLDEETSRWQRYATSLSCLLVDLDHFKQINDRFGHPAGDRTLQRVAELLGRGLRASDVLARYGGEEFALLLPATDRDQAGEIAERLRAAIERAGASPDPGGPDRVTVSIGLANLGARARELRHETPASWLLRLADRALYRAKAEGRNRVATDDGTDALETGS